MPATQVGDRDDSGAHLRGLGQACRESRGDREPFLGPLCRFLCTLCWHESVPVQEFVNLTDSIRLEGQGTLFQVKWPSVPGSPELTFPSLRPDDLTLLTYKRLRKAAFANPLIDDRCPHRWTWTGAPGIAPHRSGKEKGARSSDGCSMQQQVLTLSYSGLCPFFCPDLGSQ